MFVAAVVLSIPIYPPPAIALSIVIRTGLPVLLIEAVLIGVGADELKKFVSDLTIIGIASFLFVTEPSAIQKDAFADNPKNKNNKIK